MKRFQEKVKDIVEVRSSASLSNFLADPANTLAGYHFTDITSDLMAKWVDRIASVKKGSGAALALAGFRGVGKSHLLATIAAIVSQPELRAAISDAHVAATAERLSRRHGLVAHVRRGSAETLLAELKSAIAEITGSTVGDLCDNIGDLLAIAAAKSGDLPPVLVIDTAFGRESRVSRDDGSVLSEIASSAKELGIFVGLALDDDIAGADGINSSIASSFAIDYLDQEHLYKIVNAHLFAKNDLRRPILHDIYESYRQSMPGFRWSEGRFTSLYPLHPAILEIAPFVRLYLHDFAFLGFACEAGEKILGRPANSLIGLDEVFDSIEDRLRKVSDLQESFAAYDSLEGMVIAGLPVMQRHEAKLALKGFLLLSLMGDGVSASELAAAMLILDDGDGSAASSRVEEILKACATAMPDAIKISGGGGGDKFSFKSGSEDDVNSALGQAIAALPADVVWPILRRQTAEKFSDLGPFEHDPSVSSKCSVVWRGSIRRGEIVWSASESSGNLADWRVLISSADIKNEAVSNSPDAPICEWRLGVLTADDINTLRRFHVLQADTGFREKFRDSISTVLHVHLIAVEKIWQRIFLEEGYLLADKTEYHFSDEARAAHTLSELFTIALADDLEARFPAHPNFEEVLQDHQVSQLVEKFFSNSAPAGQDIQGLAARFAKPLGLVNETDGVCSPVTGAELLELPVVKAMLLDVPTGKNGLIGIADLSSRLQKPPYGLTREARHLVFAAMVAQRQFEFVTSSSNRINHRSLDLKIVWEDIVGIAKPSDEIYSTERLANWAALLTGDNSLHSLDTSAGRRAAIDGLAAWLSEWRSAAVLERFDGLQDNELNTQIWRIASSVKRTFGAAAKAVDGLLQDDASLDKCLQAVADAFWDSDDEYRAKRGELDLLQKFLSRAEDLDELRDYLILCEPTQNVEIDGLRASLLDGVSRYAEADGSANIRGEWERFRELYTNWYVEQHDAVVNTAGAKLEQFLSSNGWAALSELSPGGPNDRVKARVMELVRAVRGLKCQADVRAVLLRQPHCVCPFATNKAYNGDVLIKKLDSAVSAGLDVLRGELVKNNFKSDIDLQPAGALSSLSAMQMLAVKGAVIDLPSQSSAIAPWPAHQRSSTPLDLSDVRQIEDLADNLSAV